MSYLMEEIYHQHQLELLFEVIILEPDNFHKSIGIKNSNWELRIQKFNEKWVVKQEAIGNFKQSLSLFVVTD